MEISGKIAYLNLSKTFGLYNLRMIGCDEKVDHFSDVDKKSFLFKFRFRKFHFRESEKDLPRKLVKKVLENIFLQIFVEEKRKRFFSVVDNEKMRRES